MTAPEFSHEDGADPPSRARVENALARAIEQHFLGGAAELSRQETYGRAGVDLEVASRLWRALGFVDVPDDVPTFTEADVRALQLTVELGRDQAIEPRASETLARALGQAMSHLADSVVELVTDSLAASTDVVELFATDPETMLAQLFELVSPVEEPLQELMFYALNRHLVAASQRAITAAMGIAGESAPNLAVGFADLVGWTTLTRDMPSADLALLVEDFESRAFHAVAGAGGRVIKVIGDEVMFTAPTVAIAAESGMALIDTFAEAASADRPARPLRVGLAWGPALTRGGDIFGAVVNLASRCTGIARPGTMLADRAFAKEIAEQPGWSVKRTAPHRVRGYDRLETSVVRRASTG